MRVGVGWRGEQGVAGLGTRPRLAATVVLAVGIGPVGIGPGTVARIIGHHALGLPSAQTWVAADDNIIWLVRLPQVLLGMVVGAALAATGVAIQALVRNVLADPFLLGTASGASTGVAGAILFGLGASLGLAAVSVSAFVGALGATVLVFATARVGGRMTSIRLVLAGIAVAYALSALTSFLIFASDSREGIRAVVFFLLGSLSRAHWGAIPIPADSRRHGAAAAARAPLPPGRHLTPTRRTE